MRNNFQHVLKAGLIVGTLDILAAFLYYFIKSGNNPLRILKFIAGGVFGEKAFTGNNTMYWIGLLLHYLIAFCFTLLFLFVFSKLQFLKNNLLLRGIIYGILVWAIMNFLVVPLSQLPARSFEPLNSFINLVILIVCIGIPLSYITGSNKKMHAVHS